MESPAADGDARTSLYGGASPAPAPPPPPPPRGWISDLVTGAGRILAAVLGPDSPGSGSTTTSAAASCGASPSASSSPASSRHRPSLYREGYDGDHGNSPIFPLKDNKFNQSENEAVMKDYAEGSLAIISEIEPKDAIIQLLKQETYSRSECNALVKIIQERVVDTNLSGGAGGLALPINWKAGSKGAIGYSSVSPKGLLPAISSRAAHDCGFDNSGGAATTVTHDRDPFIHNADKLQSVVKRSYSVATDTPEDIRRVRQKINGNLLNISKFKQVDVIRNHPDSNSREILTAKNQNASGSSSDDKKLSDVPLLGTNNLTFSNIISKVESSDEKIGTPNKPSAGDDLKNYGSAFLNPCSNKDLKNSFPLKVEPLNVCSPFEQQMMDLSHQRHEYAVCNDSCSVSKLMFKEDIENAPSLPVGVQLENGPKNRRRRAPNTQRTPTARSPAMGSHGRNNDVTVKSEIDLPEQSELVLMEPVPDLGDVPVKRPVGRPRKAK
ncbi:hypothetical protein GUJ93_ZPchr0006g46270 [Zizania palustris]|uniref:Uncharacterized protein n=1 Tax=Zizania palustris TaxID=103762 RepID=A0A8J5SHY0_ZIZPA|nr:hypothetical protein GUJ93_ZPchr0006g46270 [Zizania palustris]